MKQIELLPKRAKPKFCNWVFLNGWPSGKSARVCNAPAVVTIGKGAYCAEHSTMAQKMFGQGKPIYAMDATGV